jgi:hypothetical protein
MFLPGVNEKLGTRHNENLSRFLIVTATFFLNCNPIALILIESLLIVVF